MALSVAYFIFVDILEKGNMADPGAMIMEFILLYIKVHIFPVRLVDSEYSIIFTISCDLELVFGVLQYQNTVYVSFIKLHLVILFHMSFMVYLDYTATSLNFHGNICCPDF